MKNIICILIGVLFGMVFMHLHDKAILQERAYTYFGEGDYGLMVNDYLQSGKQDTLFANYAP